VLSNIKLQRRTETALQELNGFLENIAPDAFHPVLMEPSAPEVEEAPVRHRIDRMLKFNSTAV
jgi:hypothetical protein